MKQKTLGSIIKEVLSELDAENEASIRQCRRNFKKLIENLGGNIDDMYPPSHPA